MIIVENGPAGTDHRVANQISALLEAGYDVSVVTRMDAVNAELRGRTGLSVLEYPAPAEPRRRLGYLAEYGYSFLAAAILSLRAACRDGLDVIQFCEPPDIYFPLAMVFRSLGTRIIIDQRDLLPELYVARYGQARPGLLWLLKLLEKLSHRAADRIICVNDYLRRRGLAASGLPGQSVSVIRNGPVLAHVTDTSGDDALKRGRRFLACWVGMMGRQDRLDLLVRSVHHVVQTLGRSDCSFVAIGDGESLTGARDLARELGLGDWLQFTGQLPLDQVFRYLATADLGLDASLQFEVSPVKVMEYMAFGVPVVAFDLPETRAISDGAAAYAEPGNVTDHAQVIDALLGDPQRRERLGEAGRARVRGDLAWEHQADTYIQIVAGLCRTTPGSRRPLPG